MNWVLFVFGVKSSCFGSCFGGVFFAKDRIFKLCLLLWGFRCMSKLLCFEAFVIELKWVLVWVLFVKDEIKLCLIFLRF